MGRVITPKNTDSSCLHFESSKLLAFTRCAHLRPLLSSNPPLRSLVRTSSSSNSYQFFMCWIWILDFVDFGFAKKDLDAA